MCDFRVKPGVPLREKPHKMQREPAKNGFRSLVYTQR